MISKNQIIERKIKGKKNDSLSLVFFELKCNIFPVHIASGTILEVVLNASSNSDLFFLDLVFVL